MLFAAPLLGKISDGIGHRRILILCIAGIAVSFTLIGAAPVFNTEALLFLARLIGGATVAAKGFRLKEERLAFVASHDLLCVILVARRARTTPVRPQPQARTAPSRHA